MHSDSPLGKDSSYPDLYSPALLHPIARSESRAALGMSGAPPFHGEDIWNAWDLTWLTENGCPVAAWAEIRVPADSESLIESKSLKLYLNSLSMSRFKNHSAVADIIASDLSSATAGDVSVGVHLNGDATSSGIRKIDGDCIDDARVDCSIYDVDAALLRCDPDERVTKVLYTDSLRSLCPVTAQPDLGSVIIQYTGPSIDPASLLRYIVSYRNHAAFHESCVERMYLDIQKSCEPDALSVYARFQRRGGIDINPFRSSTADRAENLRLWRQ
ncbi:MAG: NADPH-dependent 7-cyano-7-deazaguanine reductase QueF [Woeseiaceae bacterium]|nr:NADPH-dependent 7-cyano-7-deazaguanine reductase QueF [Woeseiaceae bacterium]